MLKIGSAEQRRALADVMEELTGFATVINRGVLMRLELMAMLDPFAKTPCVWQRVPLVGYGIFHASGRQNGFRITSPTGDVTNEVRERFGVKEFDELMAEMDLELQRSVLRGPSNDQVEELRAFGWNPQAVIDQAGRRAAQEQSLGPKLDGPENWRHGRLRDVVAARELIVELNQALTEALIVRDVKLSDVMAGRHAARAFVDAMPSTSVSI